MGKASRVSSPQEERKISHCRSFRWRRAQPVPSGPELRALYKPEGAPFVYRQRWRKEQHANREDEWEGEGGGERERWMSNTNTGTNSARLTASRVCCFHRCRADVGFFSLNTVFLPRELSPGGFFLLPLSPGLCVRINSLFRRLWWMEPVNGESMKT